MALPARADFEAGVQYNVGEFYAFGRGVAPNGVLALAWITVAEESGAPKTDLLDTLRRHMSPPRLNIQFQHHNAKEDARAAGEVLLRAMAETGFTVEQWIDRTAKPINLLSTATVSRLGSGAAQRVA